MCLNEIINTIAPILRDKGYRKSKLTWWKENGELTIIFNIQKSQYGSDVWYYNFGIGLNALTSKNIRSISGCHCFYRLEQEFNQIPVTTDHLINLVDKWEERYGEIRVLRMAALKGSLPTFTLSRAISYLTTVDLSAF